MKLEALKPWCAIALAGLTTLSATAKLPAPSDEAKAKATEAAAKTAWSNQVASFQLCKSMDRVATAYHAQARKSSQDVKPTVATPPCADPGPFVYVAPAPAATTVAAAASAPAAAPKK